MSTYCVSLTAARPLEDLRLGGKAERLALMLQEGAPIPAGFAVRAEALEEFVTRNELRQPLEVCSRTAATDVAALDDAAKRAGALIARAPLWPGLTAELHAARAALSHSSRVIVRSSALGEDGVRCSFAGQLDSFGLLSTDAALERALKACWASAWSARSIAYQRARRASLTGVGVVVQEQIASRISGVLFTRCSEGSPTTNGASATGPGGPMLVEYCAGAGEALVTGDLDPGRFTLSRDGEHLLRLVDAEGLTEEETQWLFEQSRRKRLASIASRLEERFGGPQDIEFVLDAKGLLWIVQSRPITRLPSLGTSSRRKTVWSNANINENFPEVVSPLLFSIAKKGYAHYFRNLARAFGISRARVERESVAFANVVGLQAGRLYYNLSHIYRVLHTAPFASRLRHYFDDFIGLEESPPSWDGCAPRERGWELCLVAMKSSWQYLFIHRRVAGFEAQADAFAARWRPESLAQTSVPRLQEGLREFMEIRCHRWLNASLADAAAMVTSGLLKAVADDGQGRAIDLLKGLPEIVSTRPAVELWRLSERVRATPELRELFQQEDCAAIWKVVEQDSRFHDFRRELETYLDTWGFRCTGELMLTVPSFQERPEALVAVLAAYVRAEWADGVSPLERLEKEASLRTEMTARMRHRLAGQRLHPRIPFLTKARLFPMLLSATHASIAFRERVRLKQALLYSRARRLALAMGSRLAQSGILERADDIFFLDVDSLLNLDPGNLPPEQRQSIRSSREEQTVWARYDPPDRLVLNEAEQLDPATLEHLLTSGHKSDEAGARKLVGLAAGAGRVQGRAVVLDSVTESGRLRDGDVLVARQTDPGWGPVFPLIDGLVLERGGLLSHGAILAREFGIPSVVGVKGARQKIADGCEIQVDGDRGHVLVLG